MNIKYWGVLGVATVVLAAAPAFADTIDLGVHADSSVHAHDRGLHLGQLVGVHLGKVLRADIGADLDADADQSASSTPAHAHKSVHDRTWESFVTGGVVSSIDSAGLHLAPVGAHASTTVALGSNTVIRAIGAGTTSDAITVGSKILAFGSTTATSSADTTFSASVILVLEHGFAHFMHWFRL